jgi:HAD superfamily hydrolase (TIGR01509 family)
MIELPAGDFDAFIFDCDGTLVDSMPLHHRAWQAALEECGALFEFTWPVFVSRAGMGLPQTVSELNTQFGSLLEPRDVVEAQRRHFERLMPELQVIHEVAEIARNHFGKKPMAVASGGERSIVLRSLELVELRSYFDHVVCHEDVTRGKPDPEMFLVCAQRMNAVPSRCLVFEDGEMGIAAAAAAGMPCVRIPVKVPPGR